MSQNMMFVYNNSGTMGTYIFGDNPSNYAHNITSITERERSLRQRLLLNNLGEYHTFALDFSFIGTAQYANFGTIFGLHKEIDFYPFDEVRGTVEKFTVEITNNFEFNLLNKWWQGGFKGQILMEQV